MNSPRLTNILLTIIGILLAVLVYVFYQNWQATHITQYDYERTDSRGQQNPDQTTPTGQNNLGKELVYTNDKFGVTFSYDQSHPLKDPNRGLDSSDFSIDAVSNGRTYKCKLDNGSMRLYSEKEVSETNVNVTDCSYDAPNLDSVAQGQFSASWSRETYGTGKNIKDVIVAGRPAKLVYGSTKVRTLIVLLPTPYTENGYKYDFLLLQGDEYLINDIMSTFKLLK